MDRVLSSRTSPTLSTNLNCLHWPCSVLGWHSFLGLTGVRPGGSAGPCCMCHCFFPLRQHHSQVFFIFCTPTSIVSCVHSSERILWIYPPTLTQTRFIAFWISFAEVLLLGKFWLVQALLYFFDLRYRRKSNYYICDLQLLRTCKYYISATWTLNSRFEQHFAACISGAAFQKKVLSTTTTRKMTRRSWLLKSLNENQKSPPSHHQRVKWKSHSFTNLWRIISLGWSTWP